MATRRRKTFINPSSASLEAIQQQFNPQTYCNTKQIKQSPTAFTLSTGSCRSGRPPTLRLEACCRARPRTLPYRLQGTCLVFFTGCFSGHFFHLLSLSSQAEARAPLKLGCSKEPLNFHRTLRCGTAASSPGESRRPARPGCGRGLLSSLLLSSPLPSLPLLSPARLRGGGRAGARRPPAAVRREGVGGHDRGRSDRRPRASLHPRPPPPAEGHRTAPHRRPPGRCGPARSELQSDRRIYPPCQRPPLGRGWPASAGGRCDAGQAAPHRTAGGPGAAPRVTGPGPAGGGG